MTTKQRIIKILSVIKNVSEDSILKNSSDLKRLGFAVPYERHDLAQAIRAVFSISINEKDYSEWKTLNDIVEYVLRVKREKKV